VKVLSLEKGEAADEAGVLRGDVIVGLDDAPVADVDDLQRLLGEAAIGRPIRLTLLRLTEKREVVVVPRDARITHEAVTSSE
jgi:serine protease Do